MVEAPTSVAPDPHDLVPFLTGPDVPVDLMEQLMFDPAWGELRWRLSAVIAGNPDMPPEWLRAVYWAHPNVPLSRTLVRNPSTPSDLLAVFAGHIYRSWLQTGWVDWMMVVQLGKHGNLPVPALAQIAYMCIAGATDMQDNVDLHRAAIACVVGSGNFTEMDQYLQSQILVSVAFR